ncbi:hypothetical protein KORDIASMS9_04056 [Kordia sp. SMS9]|uniref:hypothetical protein n=1 Tax=Kordia sp. SMS9 TaxID=2282170 RepID=UPI000E0CD093|nr:hypothetical protein [Kordia sp. SMS9]AXG71798.1 hypothetical protein KORDIASMS9_04056 [Kordia sp. SMS9]
MLPTDSNTNHHDITLLSIQNNILQTIHHLRTSGQFVLYTSEPKVTTSELNDVTDFLAQEYENESLNYPFDAPLFDKETATWAAKTIYYAAQFLAHRLEEPKNLNKFFEDFKGELTPSVCLSADISLRFLPFIIKELEHIDFDDWLVKLLKTQLEKFPYTTIGHDLDLEIKEEKLASLFQNNCFRTLFIDRVIAQKDISLTAHKIIQENVAIHLGEHAQQFWSAFSVEV